jgi:purine nucleoside phosphorylase
MAMSGKQYAVIAGSGFRSFGNDSAGTTVSTSFGNPSGPIRELRYDDHMVYLLPRHGDELLIPPHAINYRANMKALQQLETDCVIAMNPDKSVFRAPASGSPEGRSAFRRERAQRRSLRSNAGPQA